MKRQLIEIKQEHLLICDNPKCDYKLVNETGDPYIDSSAYINAPCPKCGENLLTEKDYTQYKRVMKVVKFLNKYFSWLTIFSKNKKDETVSVHVQEGIHIEKK